MVKLKQKRTFPLLPVVICLVILGFAIGGFLYYKNSKKDSNTTGSSLVTDSIDKQVEESKSTTQDSNPTKNASGDTQPDQQPNVSNSLQAVKVSVSNFVQKDGVVTTTASVTGSSAAGTCYFLFSTDASRPVNRSSTLNNNSCSTTIPEAEFAKLGQWQLTVSYIENNAKAETSQNVTIN